jgi:gamma-glutamylputrescine oxidase
MSYGLPYWLDFERPAFPALAGDATVDAVVIGAGISGLKLAHCLARYGLSILVLEGGRVGDGASGRNQGSMCQGAGLLYAECIRRFESVCGARARQCARDLWRLGADNARLARGQIEEYAIECDYQQEGFHLLARRDAPGFEHTVQEYARDGELLCEDGFSVAVMDEREAQRCGGSILYAGGLSYLQDAQFHSGKYVAGLAQGVARRKGVRIREHTRVLKIEEKRTGARVLTASGGVSAAQIFLATNALVPQHVPRLESGLRAERGQAFVTEPLPQRPCVGSFGTYRAWWREIPLPDGRFRLLFGGARHEGQPDSLFRQFDDCGKPHPKLEREGNSPTEAHQQRLDEQFAILFPQYTSALRTHRWGGLQCFTADHLPMIGIFDAARRIHGMAGFSGRGNTYTDVGAEVLAARVAGKTCGFEKKYGALMDVLMQVGRASADFGNWKTEND